MAHHTPKRYAGGLLNMLIMQLEDEIESSLEVKVTDTASVSKWKSFIASSHVFTRKRPTSRSSPSSRLL
jgi:hypothetical protein